MAKQNRQPEPFPHFCPECGQPACFPEIITHATAFQHEDHLYHYDVPNHRAQRHNAIIFPLKMAAPAIASWIEQRNELSALGIRNLDPVRLAQIVARAS